MAKLYILCGVPGCGKSTWAAKYAETANAVVVSRDVIRFSMLKDDDEYFDQENKVFDAFSSTICRNLRAGKNVIADATHLNERSRNKLIRYAVPPQERVEIIPVGFDIPFSTCLERNSKREGRSYVPTRAMKSMFNSFRLPNHNETYKYSEIMLVDKDGEILYDVRYV